MLKRLFYASASIFLLAPTLAPGLAVAGPGGLNLGWDDCGGLPASLDKAFACDTNAGINTVVGSFIAPSGVNAMSASAIVMDVQTHGSTLPPWWGMATGQCRTAASVAGNLDFTSGPFTCYDYWQGGAIGSMSWSIPAGSTNRCRIKGVFALPAGDARITSIPEGLEVYSFKANINNAKTVGLGSCAGCSVGACIVLNLIHIGQPVGNRAINVINPAVRNYATWQGGIGIDCYTATHAKNTTWGAIKAIYR